MGERKGGRWGGSREGNNLYAEPVRAEGRIGRSEGGSEVENLCNE